MREIKFRGFNRKNSEWLYGFYLQNRGAHFVCPDEFADGKSWDDYEIDPDTLGQFTGLQDKNGTDIFEGDIIRWDKDQKLYVVVFRNGMFYASVEECNPHIYGGFPLWCLCEEEQHCAIVGNTLDNKNLLKHG